MHDVLGYFGVRMMGKRMDNEEIWFSCGKTCPVFSAGASDPRGCLMWLWHRPGATSSLWSDQGEQFTKHEQMALHKGYQPSMV